jgi:hypothetical protein
MDIRTAIVGVPAIFFACASPTDTGMEILGTITGYSDDDPRITINVMNSVIETEVMTYGGGCYTFGRTEATLDDEASRIDVFPYDVVRELARPVLEYSTRSGTPHQRRSSMRVSTRSFFMA